MKLCRFLPIESVSKQSGRTVREAYAESRAGIIEGDTIREISGEIWGARETTGRQWRQADVKFMPPAWPSKIICMAKNYVDHATEMNSEPPKQPIIFSKPPSAIIAPGDPIVMPRISKRVDYEGELAFIIGRRCSHPRSLDDIRPYIAGYTTLNDVTARDLQRLDGQYTRGKGFDTFCPFGPLVETETPSADTTIETFVNGTRKQSARVADMVFAIDAVFRWIAEAMTLEPGDLIATGTPAGVGPLAAGDVVEVRVGGIGALSNPVVGPQE
ncbi:MAG: fumarylacetoacetate hydrolase family protein [Candidatus Acidiferrales bacterium]|jgi:2-keto-4-pentenoate hydratase/2-oxohepta-3-ene-1,7-dioic acid hydratase in catechol pathway